MPPFVGESDDVGNDPWLDSAIVRASFDGVAGSMVYRVGAEKWERGSKETDEMTYLGAG